MGRTIQIGLAVDGTSFLVRAPFSKEFVAELKTNIPPRDRSWDGDLKVWGVARTSFNEMTTLIRKHFGDDCAFRYTPSAEAALTDVMVDELAEPALEDYVYLGLRPEACPVVIHAAYDACEMFVAVRTYLTIFGGEGNDPFFERLPPWLWIKTSAAEDYVYALPGQELPPLAGDPNMGPAADIEMIRAAYARVCKHRDLKSIVPTLAYEQLANADGVDDAAAKKLRIEMLSKAIATVTAETPRAKPQTKKTGTK